VNSARANVGDNINAGGDIMIYAYFFKQVCA
jgi:hypothetical protein